MMRISNTVRSIFHSTLVRAGLVAAVAATLPSTSLAQDSLRTSLFQQSGGFSRQIAIGGGGFGLMGEDTTGMLTSPTNPFSVDPLFVLTNAAYASHYRNYISADIGSGSSSDGGTGQQFTALFDVGSGFTAGAVLARREMAGLTLLSSQIITNSTAHASAFQQHDVQNAWELIGAYDAGSLKAGLGVSLQSHSSRLESDSTSLPPSEGSYSQFAINAGMLLDFNSDNTLDVGLSFLAPKLSSTANKQTQDISYSVLRANARMLMRTSNDLWLVPVLNFTTASGTTTLVGAPKDLPASTAIDVGFGVNYFTGPFHFVGGPSFGYYTWNKPKVEGISVELNNSQVIFPRWNLGAEWNALNWLVARIGYFASTSSISTQTEMSVTQALTTTETRYNSYSPVLGTTPSGITLGVGFRFGRFTMDAAVNESVLRGGLANIGGGTPTFASLTASYSFQ